MAKPNNGNQGKKPVVDDSISTEGDDILNGGNSNDTLSGLGGNDRLRGGNGNDALYGGIGNDDLSGGNGNDSLYGEDGDDTLHGGNAKDILSGGLNNDALYGDNANDSLNGDDGDDALYGGNGVDTLLGGSGNDLLDGGRGGDTMTGGEGDDTYVVDSIPDKISESADQGEDTVETSLSSYTLDNNFENLEYTGSKNFTGTGNALDNEIEGGDGSDTLHGLDGNDELLGNDGNDTLYGGLGDDLLVGGLGDDILNGGDGSDLLLLNALSGVDTVQDFTVGSDHFVLDSTIFSGIFADVNGNLDTTLFAAGTVATTAEQRIVYDATTGDVYYDADGSGAGSAVTIAQVTDGLVLSSTDFNVI